MRQPAILPAPPRRKRTRAFRRYVLILLLLLVAAAVALGIGLWPAARAARDAESQIKALEGMKSALEDRPSVATLREADTRIVRLHADISTINGTWQSWKGTALFLSQPFHAVHATLRQVDPLLVYGRQLTEAGHTLSSALSPAVRDMTGHINHATLPTLVADLAPTRSALRGAGALLRQADGTRRLILADGLPTSIRHGLSLLDAVLPRAPDELDSLAALPAALGGDGPRNYLLVPQNSTDLRATGGFIGTVAVVHVDRGKLTLTRVEDSYAVDPGLRPNVIPPLPLALHGWSSLLFRDGNWSADYPTTAQVLEILYRLGAKQTVDGVIAFNPPLVRQVLLLTGPVAVPGYQDRIDASNFFERLDYQVNVLGKTNKAFALAAYRAVFSRLLSLKNVDGKQAASKLRASVRSRDVLIYANDRTAEDAVRFAGADGAIDATTRDYLYVVDTNMSRQKINSLVHDDIAYRATIQPDRSILATVTLRYTNTADSRNTPPLQSPGYSEFVRVLVPAGSKLLKSTGLDTVWPANVLHHKSEFSGYFTLPSKARRTVMFRYRIPSSVDAGNTYSLLVQRQPGSGSWPVVIHLTAANPIQLTGNVLITGVLRGDIALRLGLLGGSARPAAPAPVPTDAPLKPGSQPEPWLTVPDSSSPLAAS